MPASLVDPQGKAGDLPSAPLHVPREWAEAAERIQHRGIRKVIVVGATDVGKSTLCRFLLDQFAQSGCTAALLDTDLGQKTVGPPACVTLCDLHGLSLAFVGTTSPVTGWRPLIEGTRRLAQQTDTERLVVKTSGLVAGPGRRLKAAKIGVLQPDLLVALGNGPDLEDILNDHPNLPSLRLPPSPEARRKTDGERRRIRRAAFRRYFTDAPVMVLSRSFFPTTLPDGSPPAGLLLGLSDAQGCDLGLGILAGYPDSATVAVRTPVPVSGIQRIAPGSFKLDENCSEIRTKTDG